MKLIQYFGRKITKSVKQVLQTKISEDQEFKTLVKKDNISSILQKDENYPQPKRGDSKLPHVKENLDQEDDTFITQNERVERALDRLQMFDNSKINIIKLFAKEDLFLQKKLSEENAEYEKQKVAEKRKKEFKNVYKQFKEVGLEDDPQNEEQIPMFNKLSEEQKEDQLNYLMDKYDKERKIDPYLLQRARTGKNYREFIQQYLFDSKSQIKNSGVEQPIEIMSVVTNQSCSVCWVYWRFILQTDVEHKEKANKQLNNFAKPLKGKMCKGLGLKFAPDIRFKYDYQDDTIQEFSQQVSDVAEDMVQEELYEKYKSGLIDRKISKSQYDQMVQQVKEKSQKILQNQGLLSPVSVSNKTVPENKMIHKTENKSKKNSNAADKFWQNL